MRLFRPTIYAAALALAALGASLLASSPAPGQPRTIRLGLLTSMTGPAAATGEDQRRSAALAVEEVNAAGGVTVKALNARLPIELVIGDDQTSREGAVSGVTKLIVEDKVSLVFGGLGSAFGMAALPLIREHGVPYVPTPSTPLFTRTTDMGRDPTKSMVFHYQATGLMYGAATLDFLVQQVKPVLAPNRALKIAWLYQDSPFGAEYYRGYTDRQKEKAYAVETVASERFKVGETDYRAQLTKIKALSPDVLIPMGFRGETVAALQQAVLDVGIDPKRVHLGPVCACADDPLYYRDLGRIGQYTSIVSLYSTYATPKGAAFARWPAFRQSYQKRYNVLPGLLGVSAYDVVHIAARAIEQAGSLDRPRVIEALSKLEMNQLVLPVRGTIRFDPNYREVEFYLIGQQLIWDDKLKELRPVVIWPGESAEAKYQHPS
ncbi:MAG TPA: ABC transporter substrate-binding protein [Methylomirabilota bacterium]|nr:ABC transporter substrate-binding protein [Methylomirabilota bacterium]